MSALGQKQTRSAATHAHFTPIATAKADSHKSCPLCPRKQTCAVRSAMSAKGQQRTCRVYWTDRRVDALASTLLRNKAARRPDDTGLGGRHSYIAPCCSLGWRIPAYRSGGRSSSRWRQRHRRRLWRQRSALPIGSSFLSQRKQSPATKLVAEYTAQSA